MLPKMIYHILFYVTLGFIVSMLQQMVFQGLPVKIDSYFWEEWFGSSLYIFLFVQLQRRILRSFLAEFKLREKSIPMIMKYFLITQVLGFVMLMIYSILITGLIRGSFNIRLKDLMQLRFIFVYFFFIHAVIFITGVAIRMYKLYITEKDAKHQAEKSFLSAQLLMLRQQLNPHFLFNNLNIIASTINHNPTLAYDFTRSMASFYRKVLESENAGWVSVKEELKTIKSYLHILSVRFEDKLSYSVDVDDQVQENYLVPDFILQPIVENVVKHNICSKLNPLRILITVNESGNLLIKNNHQPRDNQQESLGIGWFNIENRYKYLGAKAPLKYEEDGWFCVEVSLLRK